jgi:replicative DNA helicase
MKLDQFELEIMCLAHITSSAKSMEKLLARNVKAEHFTHIAPGDKQSYTFALFKLILDYWEASGGSLFTSYILESKFLEYGVSERIKAKLLNVWTEVLETETDDNNFHEIVTQLKNKQCLRLLSDMLTESNSELSNPSENKGISSAVNVIMNKLDAIQAEMNETHNDIQNFDVSKSSDFFNQEYNKRLNHPELFKGISCGISNLDEKTFGWLPGQIVVFLAPSSGGKSVMLLNSAMHANRVCNKKVLYLSFEMNSWLCLLRHVSLMFEIPYSQIKKTDLSADEIKFITEGLKKAEDGPYFEYDVNMEDPTPEYIDSKIRDLIASKGKPDLLVVDYIGNMTVRDAPKGAKDYELQSLAIKKLFTMAKRYNIPIITAQQINREAIRDARKAKENNKFMSFDQAAVSGGQVLMHLCTYAIAMEPNKEHGYCILHPVKMRDAHFQPFPVALNPDYNKIKELTKEEQEAIMGKHSALSGSTVSTVKSVPEETKTPMRKPKANQEEEEEEFFEKVDISNDEELDLADWVLG